MPKYNYAIVLSELSLLNLDELNEEGLSNYIYPVRFDGVYSIKLPHINGKYKYYKVESAKVVNDFTLSGLINQDGSINSVNLFVKKDNALRCMKDFYVKYLKNVIERFRSRK